MSLLCFLGSNLYRGWDSDALILFIYLVHNDMSMIMEQICFVLFSSQVIVNVSIMFAW